MQACRAVTKTALPCPLICGHCPVLLFPTETLPEIDSLHFGVKRPNFQPLSHLTWTSPNVKSMRLLPVHNYSAKTDGNVRRQADGVNTRRLSQQSRGFAAILGASGRKTHAASAAARPHCPECSLLPLLLPLSSFSLCCISAGPHRSTAPSPFSSPRGVCFPRLPCFPHIPPARSLHPPTASLRSASPPHPVFRLYSASSTFFWWKLVMYACMSR